MNFRPELAQAIMDGRKWVTRRVVSDNPRSPYHPERAPQMRGKRIAICPGRGKPAIGSAEVVSVSRELFNPGSMSYSIARSEGFDSPSAFMGAWAAINGTLEDADVWRIELDRVEPAHPGRRR